MTHNQYNIGLGLLPLYILCHKLAL